MNIFNSKSAYKSVQNVVRNAIGAVNKTKFWTLVHSTLDIGTETREQFTLSATDRLKLANKVLSETGYDPRIDDYSEMVQMNRTESLAKGFDDKAFATNPREPYVEVRYYRDSIDNGYRGIQVDNALALAPDIILSVENFDTFVSIDTHFIHNVFKSEVSRSILFVFRGDSKATPKAVSNLRKKYTGSWWHFGDFDPNGIVIAISGMKANKILLPDIDSLELVLKHHPRLSNSYIYAKQEASHPFIKSMLKAMPSLQIHLDYMLKQHSAVMQEALISRKVVLRTIDI